MRMLSKWWALAGVLGVGAEAMAEGWHGYASLGAGITLDHMSDFRTKGPALHGYLGVESPPGLSVGLLAEVSETWGQQFPVSGDLSRLERAQLDYKAVGIEARLRFFRDRRINPWVGARLSKSWSSTFVPNDAGKLFREKIDTTGMAFRVGVDGWFNEFWGLSVATAFQFCDVKFTDDNIRECADPLHSVIAGPVLRF